jgi:hypothetical protein
MNSVVERFGSLNSYQIVSTALNFILCVVFLFLAFQVYKNKLQVSGVRHNTVMICSIVIALINAVSGGLNFV